MILHIHIIIFINFLMLIFGIANYSILNTFFLSFFFCELVEPPSLLPLLTLFLIFSFYLESDLEIEFLQDGMIENTFFGVAFLIASTNWNLEGH
jgi:hypothetical protein